MSVYNFLPNFPNENYFAPFVTLQNEFTLEELNHIVGYVENNLNLAIATVGQNNDDTVVENIRRSKVCWISNNNETAWLYEKLAWAVRKINSNFYNYDIFGFVEDFQFTVYAESDNSHYTWHIDSGKGDNLPRKLSLVLQLSSPEEYEGGELELMVSPEPTRVNKEKGLITIFPSYTLHRVTPVTKGIRKTLVVWIAGPAFK